MMSGVRASPASGAFLYCTLFTRRLSCIHPRILTTQSSRLRRRPLHCGSVPRACRYTGITIVSSLGGLILVLPRAPWPAPPPTPWLVHPKRSPTPAVPSRIAIFIIFMTTTVSIYMSYYAPLHAPPRAIVFAPPRPCAPDQRPRRDAFVPVPVPISFVHVPVPSPLLCPPPRASQPATARGWMRLVHTCILGWWTHRTPRHPTHTCPPIPTPDTPTPTPTQQHQPAADSPVRRRALAAPRDGHALRVGALMGPWPPRLSQSAATSLSCPVRPSVRRRAARALSNPSGMCPPPARPRACPPGSAAARARPWSLVDGVVPAACLYAPPRRRPLRMRSGRRSEFNVCMYMCTS
ncbi:hypothetical protein DFH08DRAFT_369025 [Mycena albidolilacea]|uniref:Uncharacterized protein n=1 Tax=Mycena albidolilacea TaxID=1033008 RepID=A0AAD7AK58_9AGAR|nr:hypothetical protein DFH08DRAFT_369025 [Mycena albidolilacea]